VAYLDVIIGSLVSGIALLALPLLLSTHGGGGGVRSSLPARHFTVLGPQTLTKNLGILLPTMLLLLGNQGMYQKFFSARAEHDAKVAVLGWIGGTMVLETTIIAIAVIGSSRFQLDNPREIIPATARLGLPEIPGAILLGGVFAKVISTANNYLF